MKKAALVTYGFLTAALLALFFLLIVPLETRADSRADARFEAGLLREAGAPAEGSTGGEGGSNGGESGGSGESGTGGENPTGDWPDNVNVDPELAAEVHEEYFGPPEESDASQLSNAFSSGGDLVSIINTIITRIRSIAGSN